MAEDSKWDHLRGALDTEHVGPNAVIGQKISNGLTLTWVACTLTLIADWPVERESPDPTTKSIGLETQTVTPVLGKNQNACRKVQPD